MADRGTRGPKLSETVHHVNVQEALDAALKSDAPSREERATEGADHKQTDKGLQDTRDSSTDTGTGDGRSDVTTRETAITSEVKTAEDLLSTTDTDSRAAHDALIDKQHPHGINTSSGGQVGADQAAAEDQIGQALTQSIGHFTTGAEFGTDGPQGQHGDSAPSDAADTLSDGFKPSAALNEALGDALRRAEVGEHNVTVVDGDTGTVTFRGANGAVTVNLQSGEFSAVFKDGDSQAGRSNGTNAAVLVTFHADGSTETSSVTRNPKTGDLTTTTASDTNGQQTETKTVHSGQTTTTTTTTTPAQPSAGGGAGLTDQTNEDRGDLHRAQELLHQLDPTGRLASELAAQHAGPGSGSGHGAGNSDPSQDPSNSDEARTEAGSTPLVKDLLGGDRGGGDPDFGSGVGAGGGLPAGGVINTATAGRGDPTQDSLSPIRTHGPDEREHETVKTDPTAHHDTGGADSSTGAPPPVEHVTPLHDQVATQATVRVPDTVHPHDPNATTAAHDPGTTDTAFGTGPSAGGVTSGGPPTHAGVGPATSSDPPVEHQSPLQDHLTTPTIAHVPDTVHPHDPNATSDDTDFGSGPSPSGHPGNETSGDPPPHAGTGLDAGAPVHISEPDISHIGVPPVDSEPPPAEPPPHEQIITEHEPFHLPDHLQLHDPHDDNPDDD